MGHSQISWFSFDLLEEFMREAFVRLGVPTEDAAICADVLITADKRGIDSHGIGRFKTIYVDRLKAGIQEPISRVEVLQEGPTTAVLDGHHGMGMVISKGAMDLAIEKARHLGLGMVAVRNSTHYGIAGYYAMQATSAGMIGVTGTNARPSIAPTFGVENMLGTNPLVFAFPTDETFPFVLDCATSVTQRGKIEHYQRAGEPLPHGWVIGADGQARVDTDQVLKDLVTGAAALTPLGGLGDTLGGHKGYGYAVVVEVLSAALQDGAFLKAIGAKDPKGHPKPHALGHFFLAIDIESFISLGRFKTIAGTIMRALRNSKTAPGEDHIFTAGEKEHLAYRERKNKGAPVNGALASQLVAVRDMLAMDPARYPFE